MKAKKNPHAAALARLGSKKAAKARMEKISPETRRAIAANAARVRWAKTKTKTKAGKTLNGKRGD